jgi:micrococcal nuclease
MPIAYIRILLGVFSFISFFVFLATASPSAPPTFISATTVYISPSPSSSVITKPLPELAASALPAAVLVSPALSQPSSVTLSQSLPSYLVTKVVDGDTFDINMNGKIERIRLIGVDTPETVDPRKPVQCFGQEASNFTKNSISGKEIALETDVTQGYRDKYGRLLGYAFLSDGTFVNKILLSEGYAHEYTYSIPYKYQVEFKTAEREARANNRGLWSPSACQTTTEKPTDSCVIKGNISSKGEKIYHVPDGEYYNKTIINESLGERWFCTESEAKAAGWRPSHL